MANRNIITTFLRTAAERPEQPAIVQDNASITYSKLLAEVQTLAEALSARGVCRGDYVLVFVPVSIPLYRTVLALFYLGAVPVFLDEWVSLERLSACMKVVPCTTLIANRTFRMLSRVVPALRHIKRGLPPGLPAAGTLRESAVVQGSDTALVTFTTGTTGIPKAADRTHDFLAAQLAALTPLIPADNGLCLTTLPVVVLLHLALGNTSLLPPKAYRAKSPSTTKRLAAAVGMHRPSGIITSPALADALTSAFDERYDRVAAAVRYVLTGGGPVYPDVAARLTDRFAGAAITAVYGSTEAEPISHISGDALSATSDTTIAQLGLPVGTIDASARVAIISPDAESEALAKAASLNNAIVAQGSPGEIIVSGTHVLRSYLGNDAAVRRFKFVADGTLWHRTGDCGRMLPDGQLFLLGRCSDVFVWNGQPYYPDLLRYALRSSSGIKDCALLLHSGKPVCCIIRQDSRHEAALADALRKAGLAGCRIATMAKLPTDPRHRTKMDYAALRRMLGEE